MKRSWYYEQEDELEDRNEAFGKAFVASRLQNQSEVVKSHVIAKLYTHKDGQLSLFEEQAQHQRVGSSRGIEYVKLTKRGDIVMERSYVEEYGPEVD